MEAAAASKAQEIPIDPKGLFAGMIEWFGELAQFSGRVGHAIITPPYEFRELLRQCDNIGSKSLPLVALAGSAIGVVLSLQMRDSLAPHVHDGVDEQDPTSADILHTILEGLEKQRWMFTAQLRHIAD